RDGPLLHDGLAEEGVDDGRLPRVELADDEEEDEVVEALGEVGEAAEGVGLGAGLGEEGAEAAEEGAVAGEGGGRGGGEEVHARGGRGAKLPAGVRFSGFFTPCGALGGP